MTDPVQTAVQKLADGFSCAQAVLSALGPRFGLNEDLCVRTAAAMGAGMCRMGRDCGAFTGGLMVIGLAYGAADGNSEAKNRAYARGQEFYRRFVARHQTTVCHDLIGCDLTDDAQLVAARNSGVFQRICDPLVRDAVTILLEMLTADGE